MKNFQFYHDGKEYWYSRAISTGTFVFTKHDGQWYILVTKKKGEYKYSIPGGFLEFDETFELSAKRHLENIANMKVDELTLYSIDSTPRGKTLTVPVKFYTVVEDIDFNEDYVNNSYEISWIPIKELDCFKWSFKYDEMIREIYDKKIKHYWIERIKKFFSLKKS